MYDLSTLVLALGLWRHVGSSLQRENRAAVFPAVLVTRSTNAVSVLTLSYE